MTKHPPSSWPRWLLLWSKAFVGFLAPRTCRHASIFCSPAPLSMERSSQKVRLYGKGVVLDAKVLNVEPQSITVAVNVNREEVTLPWERITAGDKKTSCGLDEIFRVGEDVKVCRKGKKAYSMQVLERFPGAVVQNKTKVFEQADETAKKLLAWERLKQWSGNPERGLEINVSVATVGPWGAGVRLSVRTGKGFIGMIPARDLPSMARDLQPGQTLTVEILELRPKNKFNLNPGKPQDYAIICSWASVKRRELCKKYERGDVVEAKVVGFFADAMDVEIDGVPFPLKKGDITSATSQWEFEDVFTPQETVKVCWTSQALERSLFPRSSPRSVISMRALERVPGEVIYDKAKVFEEADETAKKLLAWERLKQWSGNPERGLEINVSVATVGPWGAGVRLSVRTGKGFIGMIPARDLPSMARDLQPGQTLTVEILELRPKNKFNLNPGKPQDYAIICSWASVKRRELCKKYERGDVVEAKVVGFFADAMDVEIDGVPFPLKKGDITSATSQWEFEDVFTPQETVKVCWTSQALERSLIPRSSPRSVISMRALERVPGEVIYDKAKVFEEADETAKKLFAWERLEKQKQRGAEINVSVATVGPWGASVRSDADVPGIIPAREMGGTLDLQRGQKLTVEILELRPDKKLEADPRRTKDYPILCTWANVRRMELRKKYEGEDVVDAKVVGMRSRSIDVEIDGVHFPLRKEDVTSATCQWELSDVFKVDEFVKVCWILNDQDEVDSDALNRLRTLNRVGNRRGRRDWTSNLISIRALEPTPGAILEDKRTVFKQAQEHVAKLILEWEKAVKSYKSEEGASPWWQVTVTGMFSWGASVRTEEGLTGMILARKQLTCSQVKR